MRKIERFLNACRCQPVDRVPVWFMRQAGRYLPEYRAIRRKTSFLNLCRTPRLAAEVSMQPYRRYDLDAVILFSDILVLPMAMGSDVRFDESGPTITNPIRSEADVEGLSGPDISRDLSFVYETIDLIRGMLRADAPIIGFAGGPFTLASYMLEGKRSYNLEQTRRFAARHPQAMKELLNRLGEALIPYGVGQTRAGAHAFLMMDTYVGFGDRSDYLETVFPVHRRVLTEIHRLTNIPTLLYVNNGGHLMDLLADTGAQVLGLDWRIDLSRAVASLGPRVALQGNLDPAALFSSEEELVRRIRDCLAAAASAPGYIFNLGHGILPGTPVERVGTVVDTVKKLGKRPWTNGNVS